MASFQQEDDLLQKEANEIMKELLLNTPQQDQEHQAPQYSPTKTTTLVRQLFIGNLPFRVRWQDIKDLFRKAGPVLRADVALNHHDNRSKGHGTILFATVSDAQNAIDMFNGYKWLGRILEVRGDRGFVDHAQQQDAMVDSSTTTTETVATMSPKTDKGSVVVVEEQLVTPSLSATTATTSPTSKKPQSKDTPQDDQCKQVFVGNLPFSCQWQDLKDLFRHSGRIIRTEVVLNFEGRSRGFGTVLFSSHEDAKKAIEKFNGYEYNNRILRVHFDKFAASHQRLREHEAETYGQRQIHDPASVELLRQTYLPQQTAYQNMMGGFINPSLLIPMQTAPSYPYQASPQQHYQQQSFTDPIPSHDTTETAKAKTSPQPAAMYNTYSMLPNSLNDPIGFHSQQQQHQYQSNPFSFINSSSYTPSAAAYSSSMMSDDRQIHADAYGNPMAFNPYPYLTHQWVPPHNTTGLTSQHYYPPYHHHYQQEEAETEQETLSSTLERLSLSSRELGSAGLSNNNDATLDNNSPSWNNMPVFPEK